MRVEIRARSGEPNRALEEHVERRLHFALGRFGERIRQTTVQLADLNGPRGGEDQHCRIDVSLVPSGSIIAEATDAEIALAVGRAAERVARRVRDALDRRRSHRRRRVSTIGTAAVASLFALSLTAWAGLRNVQPAARTDTNPAIPCSACHTCDKPTLENLCSRACVRASRGAIPRQLSRKQVPDVVLIAELQNVYLPVLFDHKGHAEMAEMTIGCAICHHHTPVGTEQPACKSCHEVSPGSGDMRKPGLKGAYHRQCLSCHREWSNVTGCETCHQPMAGRASRGNTIDTRTKDDIMGQTHPPIPEPDSKVYQTKYKDVTGTKVLFRHKEHIHRYGLRCAECHHEDSCSRCHEAGKSEAKRVKTLEEHHDPCTRCHDMEGSERCDDCHRLEGDPDPALFDHASTGWPLGPYHENESCRACHVAVPFVKADRECNSCHRTWDPGSFDHAVTGQVLDANHIEIDCEECHVDRKFDQPPDCDECHDEEEDIISPKRRPGPFPGAGAPSSGQDETASERPQ